MSVKVFAAAAVAASALFVAAADAAIYTVQSDILDHEAYVTVSTGVTAVSNGHQGDNRIGSRTTSTLSSSILPFALPTLAAGEYISEATLAVTFEGEAATLKVEAGDGNVDLYGLPFDAAPYTQSGAYHYSGPNDLTAGVTKLHDDIMTVAEYPAETALLSKISVDISDYLNSLYAAGAVGGDFALLRLSYDVNALSGNNRYRVVTTTGDGSNIESTPHTLEDGAPFLSITTAVPEPGSLAVLGLAAVGVARRRRSR